jgi:hypothetical protein
MPKKKYPESLATAIWALLIFLVVEYWFIVLPALFGLSCLATWTAAAFIDGIFGTQVMDNLHKAFS